MYPTTPQAEPSTPALSLTSLRAALADMESAHPEYGQRPMRAASIAALRRIEPTVNGNYWVQSECDPSREYWVCPLPQFNVWRCTCKDFEQRGGPCKHALAVQLLQDCERREAARSNLLLFPVERYRDADRFELTPMGEAYLPPLERGPVA
jgi:hypothetical protein